MRKEVLYGSTRRMSTGCGNLYVTINKDMDGTPIEVFVRLGKAGGCASSQTEAIGRLITMALRAHVPLDEITHQMRGIGCHQPRGFGPTRVISCADAVAKALQEISEPSIDDVVVEPKKEPEVIVQIVETPEVTPTAEVIPTIDHDKVFQEIASIKKRWENPTTDPCPDCGATLAMEDGCAKCYACGFTRC